jgi:hypothetical protein
MDISNTQKRILIYSLIIFLTTKLLEQAYEVDISVATNLELFTNALIGTFSHFSLAVGLSGMLIIGIRNIKGTGFSIKSISIPTFAILIILFTISLSFYSYDPLKKSINFIKSKPYYSELLSSFESSIDRQDLSANSKNFISKEYARLKYQQSGLIIDYITQTGIVKTYKPDEKEVLQRNAMLKSEVEVVLWDQLAKRALWGSIIFWSLLTIVSIFIGIYGFKDSIKSHNLEKQNI